VGKIRYMTSSDMPGRASSKKIEKIELY